MRNSVLVFWLPPRALRYGVRYAVARRLGSQVVKMATHTTFISPLEGSRFNPVWSATSQDDYQPHIGAERVEAILPPPPSSILHRDAKHLSFGTSLSRSTYSVPSPCERAPHIDRHRMYATNFCMSADPQPAVTVTTHRHYHRPIAVQHPESTKKETKNPLGVRVALLTSESEYAGSFTGSRAGNAAQRDGKCMSHRDPILGRGSLNKWPADVPVSTTYTDTFTSKDPSAAAPYQLSSLAVIQQNGTSYVPQGDVRTTRGTSTNYQASYLSAVKQEPLYDKYEASKTIAASSLGARDHQTPAYCTTTTSDAFSMPGPVVAAVRQRPQHNTSCIPPGDLDAVRVGERMKASTARQDYRQPAADSFPSHVQTAGLHTLSQVHLGQWYHEDQYSTTAGSYVAKSPAPLVRVKGCGGDHVSKTGYRDAGNERYISVSASSYSHQPRVLPTLVPRPDLDNVKQSHWRQPYGRALYFSTEHRDCFSIPNGSLRASV
ncbi:hypothetical protein EMCRGX_G022022 [Ephydatia muelleri]